MPIAAHHDLLAGRHGAVLAQHRCGDQVGHGQGSAGLQGRFEEASSFVRVFLRAWRGSLGGGVGRRPAEQGAREECRYLAGNPGLCRPSPIIADRRGDCQIFCYDRFKQFSHSASSGRNGGSGGPS